MFRVTQEIRFCYGHRLLDYQGKCSRLHGHNARVEIVLEAADLDRRGFVMDFTDIEQAARRWLEDGFDHRMLLRKDDPVIPALEKAGEVFVALPFNPTAENLARMVFDHLSGLGFPVAAVRLWETDTSFATYAPRGD